MAEIASVAFHYLCYHSFIFYFFLHYIPKHRHLIPVILCRRKMLFKGCICFIALYRAISLKCFILKVYEPSKVPIQLEIISMLAIHGNSLFPFCWPFFLSLTINIIRIIQSIHEWSQQKSNNNNKTKTWTHRNQTLMTIHCTIITYSDSVPFCCSIPSVFNASCID